MIVIVGGSFLIGCVALAAFGPTATKTAATADRVAAERAATPPTPTHYYAARVGRYFGYRTETTDMDRQNGIAAKPLILISLNSRTASGYEFVSSDGGSNATLISCSNPCDFVTTMDMTGQHVIPAEPGSIIWEAIEDARRGFLGGFDAMRTRTVAPPVTSASAVAPAPRVTHHLPRYGIPPSAPGA